MVEDPVDIAARSEDSEAVSTEASEDEFRPLPDDIAFGDATDHPVWRVRFELAENSDQHFALDINGEVIFGRNFDGPNVVDLADFDAANQGVSRQHLILRPTPTHLFAIDMGSTNGTYRNGQSIGFNSPTRLINGDTLALGRLHLVVQIIGRPSFQTAFLGSQQPSPDLADALSQIAKSVTSQLELDEVLNQVTETAMHLTAAGETSIWLVDDTTGELFLKAERGIEDEKIQQMRLPIREDTYAGQVIKSGKPLYAQRQPGEERIKVKTHYLVEALLYVPITLGGVTTGVLSAVHREGGKQFNKRDERLLLAIADFAAIAIQNARLYQATDEALQRRVKELSALNEVSGAVTASLDLNRVYDVLVEQVNRHWPVEAVCLYLLDELNESLRLFGSSESGNGTHLVEMGRGLIGKVAETGQASISNQLRNGPDALAVAGVLDGIEPRSIACVPMSIQEKVVGVLALLNKANGPFTQEDVNRLVAFANPVATAIENANLFEESERQRAAIMATAHTLSQPLLILDENGKVLVANSAANEIMEKNISQLFDGISSGLGRTIEVKIGDRTFLSTAQHLPNVGTIVVMQDITYVKQLEKDRAEFMHALSHDLKSPLTSIMGWAQLLEKVTVFDDRGDKYMGKLVASAERMLDLINQMLQTVARGDIVEINRQSTDVRQVVATALSDAEGAALHKSITLDFKQSGTAYNIIGDETRLYHMVLNLIDNAIKYSPPETRVLVSLDYTDDSLTIKVQDEGAGIPEQDIPRLFDKYYRGTQAKVQPGAGLGLSVVWAIADAHGGRVSVRNLPESGAEFIATLPGSLRVETGKLLI